MPRRKRVYTEAKKEYLKEENKISSSSKEWLSSGSKLIREQAKAAVAEKNKRLKGKWFKYVLISEIPKTWKIVECSPDDPGAVQM